MKWPFRIEHVYIGRGNVGLPRQETEHLEIEANTWPEAKMKACAEFEKAMTNDPLATSFPVCGILEGGDLICTFKDEKMLARANEFFLGRERKGLHPLGF